MVRQLHHLFVFRVTQLASGLLLLSVGGQSSGQEGVTTGAVRQEDLTVVEEFRADAHSTLFPDQTYTPLSTFNGASYLIWINAERYPMMARIEGDQVQTERLDRNDGYKPLDNGHSKFSLGIDNDGYIHVVGDMHHHPIFNNRHLKEPYRSSHCLYWVSDKPEDISSFTFMGAKSERVPRGTSFSYSYFDNDNNGVLYFASRVLTRTGELGAGSRGYGLQKYDTESRVWTSLGGLPPGGAYPLIAWEDNGSNGSQYQAMRADIRFDKNNRLHFVTTINNDDSLNKRGGQAKSMTHVIYAYSDDGGDSFHQADGTAIASLPMRVDEGPNQADVVAGPIHWISMPASVAFTKDNEPFVYFIDLSGKDQAKYVQWNAESGWSHPANLPLNATAWDRQYNDGRGVITLSSLRNGIYRTADLKEQGVKYDTIFICADRRYLNDTGELRGISRSGHRISVVRLETSLPKKRRPSSL